MNSSTKPNILFLDDEYYSADYLKETVDVCRENMHFLKNFESHVSYTYADFIDKVKVLTPYLIFLDIQMPVKTGIEVAKELRDNYKEYGYTDSNLPIIVFCSAYDDYAFKAFGVDAFDYILKPATEESIQHVLDKIETQYSSFFKDTVQYLKVPSAGIEIDLPISEVMFFQADMKYVNVITSKKTFLIGKSLLSLEEEFPTFVRIHRAYLVNTSFIQRFFKKDNNWFLTLKNHDENLPVSRRHKQDIESKIDHSLFFE